MINKSHPILIIISLMVLNFLLQAQAINAQAEPTPEPLGEPTATPTVTPLWPSDTATPSATWTPAPVCADMYKPNNQAGQGPVLIINEPIEALTLSPFGDIDFFLLWGKGGTYYRLTTTTREGVDTRLQIFDPTGHLIAQNNDYTPSNPASEIQFRAPGEGWFSVAVDSYVPTTWGCRQYSLVALDIAEPTATATVTPGPSATPIPSEAMTDDYEPNYNFETAANLGVGQTISLNFNPWPAGVNAVDNDFFRLYVKTGQSLRLETSGLAPGLDTNLILYRADGSVITGNDDCEVGLLRSCIEWQPDYTGLAYLLSGPVGTIPEAISASARAYTYQSSNQSLHQSPQKSPQ